MNIGENVARLRIRNGMSQTDLANEVGCTHCTINRIERGTLGVSVQMAAKLAAIFDVTIEQLLEG